MSLLEELKRKKALKEQKDSPQIKELKAAEAGENVTLTGAAAKQYAESIGEKIPAGSAIMASAEEVAKVLPPDAPEVTDDVAAKPMDEPEKPKKKTRKRKTTKTEIAVEPTLWLFADVELTKLPGEVKPLEPYIDGWVAELSEKFGLSDIRMAPQDSPLAYGKWKAALSLLVKDDPPPKAVYTVSRVRESDIKQTVVEALRPICDILIRGTY